MSNSDPTDLRIQLEVIRERLKYAEEKSRQQEQILTQAYKDLGQKEAELKQIRSEREDLRVKWEVLQRDFKHSQVSLLQATQANTKKKRTTQLLGFLASFTFLISSLLLIPQETASALHDFLSVKNKVAHAAVFDVDEATILALVSIGIELLKIIAAKKRENTEVLSSDTA